MKAIIFAAGKGTRMRPLTLTSPKSLVKVLNRPILSYTFEALPDDVDEVAVVVGYKGDMIQKYLGDEFRGRRVSYVYQPEPLGTAHALMCAKEKIKSAGKFLVLYGDDIYSKRDLEKLLKHPRAVLVTEVDDPRRFGVVNIDNKNKIIEVEEKPEDPKSNLVNTGAYLMDESIFDHYPTVSDYGEFFLTDALASMITERDVFAEKASLWIPLGYPEDIEKAEKMLSDRNEGQYI